MSIFSSKTDRPASPAVSRSPQEQPAAKGAECRVWERHGCDMQAACQSVANRSSNDLMWPATIRNISRGGVGLVVDRRFERGTGLFIECQTKKAECVGPYMARVVHATSRPDGIWLLGCSFVRPLTDEQLNEFLQAAALQVDRQPKRLAEVERVTARVLNEKLPPGFQKRDSRTNLLAGVALEGVTSEGETVRLMVRRLCLMTGIWPPADGALLQLSVLTTTAETFTTHIRALTCSQLEGRWTIRYAFAEPQPAQVLRVFGHPVPADPIEE